MYSFCSYITVATIVGTVVAFLIVPMRGLGQDGWKIAAALMGRHIGGGNVWKDISCGLLLNCGRYVQLYIVLLIF